jgi:hypothetical protein
MGSLRDALITFHAYKVYITMLHERDFQSNVSNAFLKVNRSLQFSVIRVETKAP